MAATPEAKVKAKIKAYLKTLPNCWWFMPIGGAYTTQGIPDIVGCVGGRMFAIECKAPGRESQTTKLQKLQIAAIEQVGAVAFVASDVETVRRVFREEGFEHA